MKQHGRGSREPHLVEPDFLEALDGNDSSRASSRRQVERKTQQFCRQVQRTLNVALAGGGDFESFDGLFVEEVVPAPDCGRVLVYVVVPNGRPVADVMIAIGRQTPRLRAEVAAAITRKRAPELAFVPVGDEYE